MCIPLNPTSADSTNQSHIKKKTKKKQQKASKNLKGFGFSLTNSSEVSSRGGNMPPHWGTSHTWKHASQTGLLLADVKSIYSPRAPGNRGWRTELGERWCSASHTPQVKTRSQ